MQNAVLTETPARGKRVLRLDASQARADGRGVSDKPALDPLSLTREWVAQWEKLVNEHGAEFLARPEAARAMQAVSSATLKAQAAGNEAAARMLAAANMPSRADVEALGARLAGIEATLARIEAQLRNPAGTSAPSRPAPRRTRKPAS